MTLPDRREQCCLPVRRRTILTADLILPENDAMPGGVRTFRTAVPVINQFDLPASTFARLRWTGMPEALYDLK